MVNTVAAGASGPANLLTSGLASGPASGPAQQALKERLQKKLREKDKPEFVLAAIDIGTNSVHMVVTTIDATLPSFSIIGKEKETVRLGDFCEATGTLTKEAMARGIASLKRCMTIAQSFHADDVIAVATSAVREAGNGQVFVDR
ncbi:MAG: Ppx/GppA family phosphatase, partial [Cyanobacteria bacterium J06560_2]